MAEALTVCLYCQGAGSFGAKRKHRRIKQDHQSSNLSGSISSKIEDEAMQTFEIIKDVLPMSSYDTRHPLQAQPRKACSVCGGSGLVPATSQATRLTSSGLNIGSTIGELSSLPPREDAKLGNLCVNEACVAIVGGGLGGLALALALQHRGVPCVVLERDAHMDARAQGYGLTLQQGATAANSLGLLEACREAGVTTSNGRGFSHCSFQWDGKLLGQHGGRARGHAKSSMNGNDEPMGDGSNSRSSARSSTGVSARKMPSSNSGPASPKQNLLLSRQALRGLLLSRLNPGTVRWDCTLAAVEVLESSTEDPVDDDYGATSKENFRLWVREEAKPLEPNCAKSREIAHSNGFTAVDSVEAATREQERNAIAPILLPHKVAVLIGADGIRSSVRALLDGVSTGRLSGCPRGAFATINLDAAKSDLAGAVGTPEETVVNSEPVKSNAIVNESTYRHGHFFPVDGNSESGLVYLGVICVLGIVATSEYLPSQSTTAEDAHKASTFEDSTKNDFIEGTSAATTAEEEPTGYMGEAHSSNVEISETVDGVTRLYRMPFSRGAHNGGDRDMWQLSWPEPNEQVARSWANCGSEALLAEARRRCGGWHAPLPALLGACCADNVTGYPLYDRPAPWHPPLTVPLPNAHKKTVASDAPLKDVSASTAAAGPVPVTAGVPAQELTVGAASTGATAAAGASLVEISPAARRLIACSTLLGDAAHPMAPFKGQGANQALLDAICLARVLYDSLLGDNARPLPPVCLPGDETSAEAGAPCQSPETESSHTSALATVPSKRSGGQGLKRSRCLMPVALEAYAYEMQGRAAVKMDTSRANTALLHTAAALAPAHGSVTRAAAAATAHSTITKKLIGDGNAAVPTANL